MFETPLATTNLGSHMAENVPPDPENELETQINALRVEVSVLNRRMSEPILLNMGRQFLRGIAWGLGSFLGATLVVSALIYSLSSIDFIPLIGEWAKEIAAQIQKK